MSFKISTTWVDAGVGRKADAADATLSSIRILLDSKNVTEWHFSVDQGRSTERDSNDKLLIPAYFLAEWVAENWWSILYEPKKSDDECEDPYSDYYSRHSIVHAQNGFGLPDLRIVPTGDSILIFSRTHEIPVQSVKFSRAAAESEQRNAVEKVLSSFVVACISRLNDRGIRETNLQEVWSDIEKTTDSQKVFCKLAGSLGANPYYVDEYVLNAIDSVYDIIGEAAAFDFCQASTQDDIVRLSGKTSELDRRLNNAEESDLSPLAKFSPPADKLTLPSWRRGINAAKAVRNLLNISVSDNRGADKLFETLRISTDSFYPLEDLGSDADEGVVAGAVERDKTTAKFLLMHPRMEARRFSASRTVFLALLKDSSKRRLATRAVTRDQQASRAFAAELLAPVEYLRTKRRGGRLHRDTIMQIAEDRCVSPEVVRHQAQNNGMIVG